MRRLSIPAILLLGAAAGLTAAGAHAQRTLLPDSPIGALATAWLEAFNSGDVAAMRAFNEAHLRPADLEERSMEERLNAYRRISGEVGAMKLIEVMGMRRSRIVLLAESATGERIAVSIEADPDDPERIASVLLEPADEEGEPVETGLPMTEAALRDSIDAWVERNVAADRFAGVIRLVDGDRTVYERVAGLAERRFDVPNTIDTRFNIGSITKLFTKIAIAKLMSEGEIAPEDRLSKHLPDYRRDVADRITIAQLLEHESGLGDIFGPEYDAIDKSHLRELSDFLPLFVEEPLRFEPGTDRYYSNAGYTVLGLVIERLSGMEYHEYVRRVVYEPAGMIASGPTEADRPTPNLATGYTRRPLGRDRGAAAGHAHDPQDAGAAADRTWELRANTHHLAGLSGSAGGGHSNAADLDRFARAFRHDVLLPPPYTLWVLGGEVPKPGARPAPSLTTFPPGAAVGVAGGAEGLNAVLEIYLDRDLTLVVLANMDPPIAEEAGRKIRGWMRRAGLVRGKP